MDKTNLEFNTVNESIVRFIRDNTTIICKTSANEDGTFWDGISTFGDTITVNLDMAHPGDLLHEAGHLATMLLPQRLHIMHNMDFMPELAEAVLNHSMPYGDDDAATGWAYAACVRLNLPTTLPFDNGYDNEEIHHETCQSPRSRFGYPLYTLGLLKRFKYEWNMIAWDINLLGN
jgi:hypothetical protein